jgi:hypothetical protein
MAVPNVAQPGRDHSVTEIHDAMDRISQAVGKMIPSEVKNVGAFSVRRGRKGGLKINYEGQLTIPGRTDTRSY